MEQPDAKMFANAMLWHLTGIRADLVQIRIYILEQKAMQSGRSHLEIFDEWQKENTKSHEKLYREALEAVALKDHREGGESSKPPGGEPSRL